ncbi:MAG: hypothetical protein JJU45_10825 [Acidimicrobiia bacterium]|nr:hypothetical protein [Acidimicrobiia bacterium]
MGVVLLVHVLVAGVAAASASRLGPRVFLLCALAPASTVAWLAVHSAVLRGNEVIEESWAWVPALSLDFDVRVDAFSALMLALIGGIGVAVFVYAWQ